MKGGPLCTKFALAGLGLSSFISFCKKWYIRDEVCDLTKKKRKTRRERLKSALYLRLKKLRVFYAQDVFMKSFENTFERHPKCAFHARYDWKITFPDSTGNKKNFEIFLENFFLKFFFEKTSKTSHSAEK